MMRSRTTKVLVGVVGVLALLFVAGGLWLRGKVDPSGPAGSAVRVDIALGTSTSEIADLLADEGVVSDGNVFRLYLRLKGGGPFKAGVYDLNRSMAMGQAVDALERGPLLPPAASLTIPEGLTLDQISVRVGSVGHLDANVFLELAKGGTIRSRYQPPGSTSLEGLLFPETYRIDEDEDEAAVLRRLVTTFEEVADGVGVGEAQTRVGVTPYQAVIVASLVEAEAKADDDRDKIARVIYNRLAKGMPLGIDAAFYYVLPPERRGSALRRSDLDRDGPYNTRLRAGLVPTPIMAPSKASLNAALHPAPGPWLYYVLKDKTTHAFTDDYNQFLRDKRAAEEQGLIP